MKFSILMLCLMMCSGCATTYRPRIITAMNESAFSLTPAQCLTLKTEKRSYTAWAKALLYVAGAGALVAGTLAYTSTDTATAVSSGLTLASTAGATFSMSQSTDLGSELEDGGCYNHASK